MSNPKPWTTHILMFHTLYHTKKCTSGDGTLVKLYEFAIFGHVLCWSSRSMRFFNTHATSLISWFVGEHRQNPSEEAEFPALIIICIQANLEARGGEFEFLNSWIWPRKKGGWLTKHMLNQLKTKKTKKMMRAVCRKQTHWQSNSVKG